MKKNNYIEILCYILFCTGTIILSCFHEPCFDEFQAWNISKDSIYNILFVIPHFEGHPPFWYLILKCFSHFNINCEPGIKIPNLMFMFAAIWLLIFKSPFPRVLKLILPFTYFLFYQYSIINRPYSIFCFAIFLAAVFYKERNDHPYKFVTALALLCLSSAYGMVIAAGIIICWFIEIIRGQNIIEFIKNFVKDSRFYLMFLIFLLCLCLAIMIYPDKNILYTSSVQQLDFLRNFIYSLFLLPADALFSNVLDYSLINMMNSISINFVFECFSGYLVLILFFFIFKFYKKLLLFCIPYLMFILISACVYIYPHHIGLVTIFYIFVFWCALSETDKQLSKKSSTILYYFTFFVISVQLVWSICSYFYEIKYPYSASREMVQFIKDNNLFNYKILPYWYQNDIYINKKTNEIIENKSIISNEKIEHFLKNYNKYEQQTIVNLYQQNIAVIINPYFNRNIFYCFNIDNPERQYVVYKKMNKEESALVIKKIREKGLPDVIINNTKLDEIFDKEDWLNIKYIPIKEFNSYQIYKNKYKKTVQQISVKDELERDILKDYKKI